MNTAAELQQKSSSDHSLKLFKALVSALGSDGASVSENLLKQHQTATFPTENTVHAVTYPRTPEDVQQIFKIAAQFAVNVYPVSGGRNWGLGSAVPTEKSAVVIDLSRMNQILDFDETLSYVTVEPGVTFRQLASYLKEKNSELFCAMIGGPADASLIGNASERGDGVGPHGDRACHIAGLQVVLPNGEILETGFGAFGKYPVTPLSPHAPGPDLQGLFLQSNFGIVTRMTFWLRPKPAVFHALTFTISCGKDIEGVIAALRQLQGQGVIHSNCSALWNVWKLMASQMQYPWKSTNGRTVSEKELRALLPSLWRDVAWCGYIPFYSASRAHARATEKLLKKRLRPHVDSFFILNRTTDILTRIFKLPIRLLSGFDLDAFFNSFYRNPVAVGIPMDLNVKSLYWRKHTAPQPPYDPHADKCGLHWVCHSIPFRAEDISTVERIVSEISKKHGFEPNVAFLNTSERVLRLFSVLTYDRTIEGEDEKAKKWLLEVHQTMISSGYPPFRLGIQLMDNVVYSNSAHRDIRTAIKSITDPAGILAPHRYAFLGKDE